MSLSKLNIELLVEEKTSDYIHRHNRDYSDLRNPCILPSPVSAVIDEVNIELSEILSTAKQESTSQLISDACKNQQQHDLMEEKADEQQERDDWRLSTQLKSNLQRIEEELREEEREINKDQKHIQSLQLHLKRIEEQININNQKNEETTRHHAHPATETSPHNHTHPETQHDKHEHSHPEASQQHVTTTHTHPKNVPHLETTHSHPNSIQEDLQLQKNELIQQIKSLEINLLRLQQLKLKKQVEQYKRIIEELAELSKKKEQRQERARAREVRQDARSKDDPNLLQLSQINRTSVTEAIKLAHEKLTQKKAQLLQEANEISYQIYLKKLEVLLSSVVKLNYPEYQALKQIIQCMKAYVATKAEENNRKAVQEEEQRYKSRLVQQIRDSEKKVEQFKSSNPQLASTNLNLAATNKQLETSTENSRNYRNKLAKVGLLFLLFTGGAAATGLAIEGGVVAITSLVLAPAAVLAAITLSIFIAALIYAIKTSIDSNQLNKNKVTIEANHEQITQQTSEMISLEQTVIPDLKSKLNIAEQEISKVTREYLSLQKKAQLQWEQARKVTVTYPSTQLFTNELPPQLTNNGAYQFLIQPTAPEMDDPTEQAFTYN